MTSGNSEASSWQVIGLPTLLWVHLHIDTHDDLEQRRLTNTRVGTPTAVCWTDRQPVLSSLEQSERESSEPCGMMFVRRELFECDKRICKGNTTLPSIFISLVLI